MSIASLQARISANNQRITRLEQECQTLKKNITRMYDEEKEHYSGKSRFDRLMTWEHDKAANIQSFDNVRIAKDCGKDLANLLSGRKASSAISGFEKISKVFIRRIEESEENLRKNRDEICRLQEDNASCQREIARIREEERRAAERRARENSAS